MAAKRETTVSPATVSSSSRARKVEMRVRTLATVVLIVALTGLGFYGGYLYGSGSKPFTAPPNLRSEHRFAIGMVVYISPTSITVSNQNDTGSQSFGITAKTIISINGQKSSVSQIKSGDIALIRELKSDPSKAGVILVNSHFSD